MATLHAWLQVNRIQHSVRRLDCCWL